RLIFTRTHCAARGAGMRAARSMSSVRPVAVAALRGVQFADDVRKARVIIAVEVVVRKDVAGLLTALALFLVGLDNGRLDHFAAGGVDRMRDVGMQLDAAVGVAGGPILIELAAALIAIARPQMVLAAAAWTAVGQLPARHGHKRAFGSFYDFQVADDESIVE